MGIRSHQSLYRAAHQAGMAAGKACKPTPMIVEDSSRRKTYQVDGGVCGFAFVTIAGNSGFGRWAKASGHAHKREAGGLAIWVAEFGQSMERKIAYAIAFAKVLNAAGVKAGIDSRID